MIGVLLVVVSIEAHGRLGYSTTLSALRAVVRQSEEEAAYLTLSKARESIAGFPSEVALEPGPISSTIRLSWFSLLKSYEVDLQIEPGSDDPMFLGYSTPDAPPEQYWTSESGSQFVDSAAADAAVPGGYPGSPPGMAGDPFARGGDNQGGGAGGGSSGFGSGEAPDRGSDRPQRPPLDEPADADAPSGPPGA
jgi:hypothetical protein